MISLSSIRHRFTLLRGVLDERSRRLVVAAESTAMGPGGISAVSRATGVSRQVIRQGTAELKGPGARQPEGRIRRPGGGRKKTVTQDRTLNVGAHEKVNKCEQRPGGRRGIGA